MTRVVETGCHTYEGVLGDAILITHSSITITAPRCSVPSCTSIASQPHAPLGLYGGLQLFKHVAQGSIAPLFHLHVRHLIQGQGMIRYDMLRACFAGIAVYKCNRQWLIGFLMVQQRLHALHCIRCVYTASAIAMTLLIVVLYSMGSWTMLLLLLATTTRV